MIPLEIQVQEQTREFLGHHGITPYSVVFVSSAIPKSMPVLRITFWVPGELQEFKDIVDWSHLVDRSGYSEFPETKTVILSSLVLASFFRQLQEEGG